MVLLAISILLHITVRVQDGFATWYVNRVYPVFLGTVGRLFGSIPFPVAEIIIYVSIAFLLVYTIRFWGKPMGQKGKNLLYIVLPVILLLYTMNGGINYYAESFSQQTGIKTREYTKEDLKELCVYLQEQVNAAAVSEEYKDNKKEWKAESVRSMNRLGEQFTSLAGFYPMPKEALNSQFMSVQHLGGLYTPFTMEIYFNGDMPDYNVPHTMCHELAHSKGFMREDEANFIGYLACINSEHQAFQYSGYLIGWIYAGNALAEVDWELYQELSQGLNPQVKEDLQENNLFWNSKKGVLSQLSNQWRDTYLKMNNQPDGIYSYDGMVELMLAYYVDGFVT